MHTLQSLTANHDISTNNTPIGKRIKRSFDILVASVLLILSLPIFLIIVLILKCRERGPIIYAHSRVGYHGSQFMCLKFRTMVANSQAVLEELLASDPVMRAEWEKNRKLKKDPRLTSTGRFLRKMSLDELPQLINVLRGEMSLVGPRPIVTSELSYYGHQITSYLAARPGITGLWQVSGRSDCGYEKRVMLDVTYVRTWHLSTDLYILLSTVLVLIQRKGSY